MDWVLEFYTLQDKWSGCYTGDVTDDHREKAAWVDEQIGPGTKRILELGAGGGQMAAAMADLGHEVVAVELVPSACDHAWALVTSTRAGRLTVIEGDFYECSLEGKFDALCYWDGFGIGSDADQRRLFKRIASWLTPDGVALIEVATPWYAASVDGRRWQVGEGERQYSFDGEGCRWNDRWWPIGEPEQAVEQSVRCYSPADLRLLVEGTGLAVAQITPGGTVDWDAGKWLPKAPMNRAMRYVAALTSVKGNHHELI